MAFYSSILWHLIPTDTSSLPTLSTFHFLTADWAVRTWLMVVEVETGVSDGVCADCPVLVY